MEDWFADEHFWERLFPIMFSPERYARAGQEIDELLALTGVRSGRVLDMACGPGRHAVAVAERGFRVTGVDLSSFLLSKAREHAKEANVDVEWVQEDMRSFVRPASLRLGGGAASREWPWPSPRAAVLPFHGEKPCLHERRSREAAREAAARTSEAK